MAAALGEEVRAFVASAAAEMAFPPTLTAEDRKSVHEICYELDLTCKSWAPRTCGRFITISKPDAQQLAKLVDAKRRALERKAAGSDGDVAAAPPPAKRQCTGDAAADAVRTRTVSLRATLPTSTPEESALALWRIGQLKKSTSARVTEESPSASSIAVVAEVELSAFPEGNYRNAADWMMQDGGLAKMEQAEQALQQVVELLDALACLECALDQVPARAPEVTPKTTAAALALLHAELEELKPADEETSSPGYELKPLLDASSTLPLPKVTESAAGAAAVDPDSRPDSCPAGHKLTEHSITEPAGCDACSDVVFDGAQCHSCVECEYDLCHPCFLAGKAGTTAPEEDDDDNDEGDGEGAEFGEIPTWDESGCVVQLLKDCCDAIHEMITARPLSALHKQIHISAEPVLSVDQCNIVVKAAEAHA